MKEFAQKQGKIYEPIVKFTNKYGIREEMPESEYHHKVVLRDAQRLTNMPLDMTSYRNNLENKIVRELLEPEHEANVMKIVEEYF
jgi:hypothetical protein